jgi:uncharacterized DUF497 family protein
VADYVDDEFEWDIVKSDATKIERGFDFHFAATIFKGDYVERIGERHSDDGVRWTAFGPTPSVALVVVYTDHGKRKRNNLRASRYEEREN